MAGRHLALYGNVAIPRRFCDRCKQWALVVDGVRQCCGYSTQEDFQASKRVRMSNASRYRHKPTQKERDKILERQENRCLYCQQLFGSYFIRGEKLIRVECQYDHLDPFCYSQNNDVRNFVAACRTCNAWKGSKMFESIEQIRKFLLNKWEERIWQKYGRNQDADARIAMLSSQDNESTKPIAPQNVDGEIGKNKIQE